MKMHTPTVALCALPMVFAFAAATSSDLRNTDDRPVAVLREQACMDKTTIPPDDLCAASSDCSLPAAVVNRDLSFKYKYHSYHPNLVQVWTKSNLDCVDLGLPDGGYKTTGGCRHHAIVSLGDSAYAIACMDSSENDPPSPTITSLTSSVNVFAFVAVRCHVRERVRSCNMIRCCHAMPCHCFSRLASLGRPVAAGSSFDPILTSFACLVPSCSFVSLTVVAG
jgi:hypothetical protein